ncbi:MAG: isopeptide-forming domain-containing fimbrial protein [Hominisplanchenecus sp.]
MKKNMKRMWAFLLAAIMVVMSCMTVFASEAATPTAPSASDTATITVKDVKENATVTAYKIVEAEYNEKGFVKYKTVQAVTDAGLSIADVTKPTSDEIYAIAQKIASDPAFAANLSSAVMGKKEGEATTRLASVGAGEYVVIAAGADEIIYNPMLLSAYYTVSGSDNTMEGGIISAKDDWRLEGTNAKAKSSEATITKTITQPNDGTGTNGHGSDAAVGDVIKYHIEATIPSYSAEYTTVKYVITDTMGEGLTPCDVSKVAVTVGDEDPGSNVTVNVTGQTITITFDSAYILSNGGKTVKVDYEGTINDTAKINMQYNGNTAKVEYTNDPSDSANTTTKEDKTYVYTFALDGQVNGTDGTDTFKTHEIIKAGVDGEERTVVTEADGTEIKTKPLAGATFTLTNNTTGKVYTSTTDTDGFFDGFTGLDAGTYTLMETAAPDGYSLDPTEHTVVIAAEYNPDGTLSSYSVTVDGSESKYTATYEGGVITKIESSTSTVIINNTKMGQLPSTGGMGTYLFTVIGVALMVIAAALYLRKRKQA